MVGPEEILEFWLDEVGPKGWYENSEVLDQQIRTRFQATWQGAREGNLGLWLTYASGALAYIILMDQFPRNMFRDTAEAFKTDEKILLIVKGALHKGFDQLLSPVKRRFIYMPFMHSENVIEQRRCVSLFDTMKEDDPLSYDYALKHLEVIEKFGRFAHRNKILGRESSEEELEYLNLPGAGF